MRTVIRRLFLFLCFFCCVSLRADDLRARLAPMAAVRTVQADFCQTRHLAELDMTVEIRGSMTCERGGRLRWQVDSPMKQIILIGEKSLRIHDVAAGKTMTVDVKKFPWLALIRSSLADTMTGDIQRLQTRFQVKELEKHKLRLIPADDALKMFFESMDLTFRADFAAVEQIMIHERSGDRLEIRFLNVKNDPAVPEQHWQLP